MSQKNNVGSQPDELTKDDLAELGYRIVTDSSVTGKFRWTFGDQYQSDYLFDSEASAIVAAGIDADVSFYLHRCDNCGLVHSGETLRDIKHYSMRVTPGGTAPSGECKECGALCFPMELEPFLVAYSPNESAIGDGAGFWSNQSGWVELSQATMFNRNDAHMMNLPVSTGQDARWLLLSEANASDGECQPSDYDSQLDACINSMSQYDAVGDVYVFYRNGGELTMHKMQVESLRGGYAGELRDDYVRWRQHFRRLLEACVSSEAEAAFLD